MTIIQKMRTTNCIYGEKDDGINTKEFNLVVKGKLPSSYSILLSLEGKYLKKNTGNFIVVGEGEEDTGVQFTSVNAVPNPQLGIYVDEIGSTMDLSEIPL